MIWTPKSYRSPRPTNFKHNEYKLPIKLIGEDGDYRHDDEMLLDLMLEHPPETKLWEGDVVKLKEVPPLVRNRFRESGLGLPVFWKVRYVVSKWAFELHSIAHSFEHELDSSQLSALMSESELRPDMYGDALVYAHALPHGMWPDSANWFPARSLRKIVIREENPDWEIVLDEAKAPWLGINTDFLGRPFVWDMAPDLYRDGENVGRPFDHEEATINTMCSLGMEDFLLGDHSAVGEHYFEEYSRPMIDPEHDIFENDVFDDEDREVW